MNPFLYVAIAVLVILLIGIVGFRYLFNISWVDSFYSACLVLTGLSMEQKPIRDDQKVFLGFYSLLAIGLYLLFIAALIPIFVGNKIEEDVYETSKPSS